MEEKNYMGFVRFIAVMSMVAGMAICSTAFSSNSMSEVWYVILAYFLGACSIASGVILFITAKFEVKK